MSSKVSSVNCPYCGNTSKLVSGDVIYPHREDLKHKRFYLCIDCVAYVGCHKDTDKPLGTLADAQLRSARGYVHEIFDPIWKTGALSRKEAYAQLATRMGIDKRDCHIAMFDVEMCRKAWRAAVAMRKEIKPK